jgi:hypothetical protein
MVDLVFFGLSEEKLNILKAYIYFFNFYKRKYKSNATRSMFYFLRKRKFEDNKEMVSPYQIVKLLSYLDTMKTAKSLTLYF